jgi:ribonuclease HII
MKSNWKKLAGIAAVLALASLLVFNGVVFAQGAQPTTSQTQGSWPPSWFGGMMGHLGMWGRGGMMGRWGGPDDSLLSIAAKVLDKTQTELAQALRDGKTLAEIAGDKLDEIISQAIEAHKAELDKAVADGKLSQAQADAMLTLMKANLEQRAQQSFQPRGWGFGPDDSLVAIAAEVLDQTQADIAQALRDGKTLAEIAGDKLDEIINQAVEARKAELDKAVADGKLSQAQADAMLALMKANLEQRAQQSFQAPGWGFGPGRGDWNCGPGMGPGFRGKGDWDFGRMGGHMGGWRGNR